MGKNVKECVKSRNGHLPVSSCWPPTTVAGTGLWCRVFWAAERPTPAVNSSPCWRSSGLRAARRTSSRWSARWGTLWARTSSICWRASSWQDHKAPTCAENKVKQYCWQKFVEIPRLSSKLLDSDYFGLSYLLLFFFI